jgi:alpha-glucosidase (family GH31 glycosyl hydrolase)
MKQFIMDTSLGKANDKAIVKGKYYRITVLTDRLVRFEYNKNGIFEDKPTQFAINRIFDVPLFTLKEDNTYLELSTKYFKVEYTKEKSFIGNKLVPGGNLRVTLLNTGAEKIWYPNHPEVRNYSSSNILTEELDGKTKFSKGLYSDDGFVSIDDSTSLLIESNGMLSKRVEESTDIYLFAYNKDFGLCLKDFFDLTGKPPLLPRYALGNWWGKNYSYSEEEILKLFSKFHRYEIPISVFLMDKDWHTRDTDKLKNLTTGFTFNKSLIPSPQDFIKRMHVLGVRVGLNVNPIEGIMSHEEAYVKAASYMEQPDNKVIPFNVYNQKLQEVYFNLLIHPLTDMGIDFIWNDYFNKKDETSMWLLSHYQFMDSGRNDAARSMVLTRNPIIGAHRYGILYSGHTKVSWDTLKLLPYFNSSASNMGISWWSHDIGGFHTGVEDGELYLRYVQLGAFSPIFRIHVDKGKYYKREPWRWDVQTFEIIKDYMQLRHRLIPYLYNEAYRYYKVGTPLVQPLYYRTPTIYDEPLYKNEYYLGSELLVSPLTDKKDVVMDRVIHKFYLPAGMWYDFKTGKKFPGERSYVSFFRDQDYPVFAKSGSIIPLSNDTGNNVMVPNEMEIHIFPGKSNTYKLYEDDGITNLYKQGFYLMTNIEYNYQESNYTVIIRALEGKSGIVPKYRNYKIRFRNTKETQEVIAYANDVPVETKCYVDENDFIVEVKNISTIGQLTINCKGKAIEIDAVRLINEDIDGIISDLAIETQLKEVIASILFGDLPIKKKRIEIKKLRKRKLEEKFIKMFIRLLEYIEQI